MPSSLEYARAESEVGSLALTAFVCGLCSGPVAFGLALLGSANHLPEPKKELIGLIALIVVLGGAFIFGVVARVRLPSAAPSRQRLLANIAIVAPVAWVVVICAFIMFALSQLGRA